MKTRLDCDVELEIEQERLEIKFSWGQQKVVVCAKVRITSKDCGLSVIEDYEIEFSRNQITGAVMRVYCKERAEETTTEHTLCKEVVEELCEEKLNNY